MSIELQIMAFCAGAVMAMCGMLASVIQQERKRESLLKQQEERLADRMRSRLPATL